MAGNKQIPLRAVCIRRGTYGPPPLTRINPGIEPQTSGTLGCRVDPQGQFRAYMTSVHIDWPIKRLPRKRSRAPSKSKATSHLCWVREIRYVPLLEGRRTRDWDPGEEVRDRAPSGSRVRGIRGIRVPGSGEVHGGTYNCN